MAATRQDDEQGQGILPIKRGFSLKGRWVQPASFTDALIMELGPEMFVFYEGLWVCADDWGYLRDDPAQIQTSIWHFDELAPIDAWIDLLVSADRVRRFVAPGSIRILGIPKFLVHQSPPNVTAPRFGHPEVLGQLTRATSSTKVTRGTPTTSSTKVTRGKNMKDAVRELRPWDGYALLPVPTRRQRNYIRNKFEVGTDPVKVNCDECGRTGTLMHFEPRLGRYTTWDGATVASCVEIVPDPDDDGNAFLLCRLCREERYGLPACPPPRRTTLSDENEGAPAQLGLGMEEVPAGSEGVGDGSPVIPITRSERAGRARTLVFEAVAEACLVDISDLTPAARGALNKAVSDLRKVGATSEEVAVRGDRYRRAMPQARLTPSALAKHWPQLGDASARASGPNRNVSSFEGVETGVVQDA